MKSTGLIFITTLLAVYICVGCRNSSPSLVNWNCKTIDDERICVPPLWKFKQQSKTLFFSYLDNKDDNSYFAILKFNKTASGFTAVKYLKEYYLVLKRRDSLETTQGYTLKKLTSGNLITYYNEIYTSISNKSYITYSTVFEKNDDLFEIILKIDIAHSAKFKGLYKDALFSFYHKNEAVFTSNQKIDSIELIDMSKF